MCQFSKTDVVHFCHGQPFLVELLTLTVLLLEMGLLPLQLSFSSSLFILDLLPQILYKALLQFHVLSDKRLLSM